MKKIVIFIVITLILCTLVILFLGRGELIKVDAEGGVIHGELIHYSNDVVIVIIAGSGPTDMNGNTPLIQGKNDSFLQLAKQLEKYGISTFRYDKRSAGKSAESFDSTKMISFETLVDDLNACIDMLREKGYKKVILAGHSQGSLIGMLAADKADGFISISGPGYPINETMLTQYSVDTEMFSKEIETVKMLEKGELNFEIAEDNPIYSINNQKFLLSWMKYDPRQEISKLGLPVMLIQGDLDSHVSLDDMNELNEASTTAQACIIKNMNHVLKKVVDENESAKSYQDPSFAIHNELIDLIVGFTNEIIFS